MYLILEILKFLLISLIIFLPLNMVFKRLRVTSFKLKSDHLYRAYRQLLDLYAASEDMYKLPQLTFAESETTDISDEEKLVVVHHTLKRKLMIDTVHKLQVGIRANLEAAREKDILELYKNFELVYPELRDSYGNFLQYLQTEYNPRRLRELYQVIPESFSDENNLITKDVYTTFFELESKIRKTVSGLELKIVEKK